MIKLNLEQLKELLLTGEVQVPRDGSTLLADEVELDRGETPHILIETIVQAIAETKYPVNCHALGYLAGAAHKAGQVILRQHHVREQSNQADNSDQQANSEP